MSDRRPKTGEASTDSIDVSSLHDGALTQTYEAATRRGKPGAERGEFEANVILIAHPDNKMLGSRFRLGPGAVIELGRSPAAEISLPEVLSISRNHARLEHRGSRVRIEDLGSTNGTYVNDEPVHAPVELNSGDRFQIGAVHFKFLHERDVEHAYHQAIYNLVMRDGLTEAYNKRKYEEEMSREFARSRRYGRPLGLILFDIDRFKALNDSYGHLCGDYVLKQLTRWIGEVLRTEQIFARVGGEEFTILCPESDLEGTRQLAEKLRQAIAEKALEYAGFELEVTCSFGVAGATAEMEQPEELYEAADRALYRAKNEGRDRVVVWDEESTG